MSGHLLSTVNPEAAAEADSGWKPAGPPLGEEAIGAWDGIKSISEASMPMDGPRPLPSVGMDVVYHLRDGDARNMRTSFPAVVLSSDPETRTCSLVVTVDAGDLWRQDRVPQYAAPEAGWDWIERDRPPMMSPVWSDSPEPDMRPGAIQWVGAMHGNPAGAPIGYGPELKAMIDALHERISALEAKRGPGRPPKPKDE